MKVFLKNENQRLQGLSRSAHIRSKALIKANECDSLFTQGEYPNTLSLFHDYVECLFYAYITYMPLSMPKSL